MMGAPIFKGLLSSCSTQEAHGLSSAALEWHALLKHLGVGSPYLLHPHCKGRHLSAGDSWSAKFVKSGHIMGLLIWLPFGYG